jgi:hypothetical protein
MFLGIIAAFNFAVEGFVVIYVELYSFFTRKKIAELEALRLEEMRLEEELKEQRGREMDLYIEKTYPKESIN